MVNSAPAQSFGQGKNPAVAARDNCVIGEGCGVPGCVGTYVQDTQNYVWHLGSTYQISAVSGALAATKRWAIVRISDKAILYRSAKSFGLGQEASLSPWATNYVSVSPGIDPASAVTSSITKPTILPIPTYGAIVSGAGSKNCNGTYVYEPIDQYGGYHYDQWVLKVKFPDGMMHITHRIFPGGTDPGYFVYCVRRVATGQNLYWSRVAKTKDLETTFPWSQTVHPYGVCLPGGVAPAPTVGVEEWDD